MLLNPMKLLQMKQEIEAFKKGEKSKIKKIDIIKLDDLTSVNLVFETNLMDGIDTGGILNKVLGV